MLRMNKSLRMKYCKMNSCANYPWLEVFMSSRNCELDSWSSYVSRVFKNINALPVSCSFWYKFNLFAIPSQRMATNNLLDHRCWWSLSANDNYLHFFLWAVRKIHKAKFPFLPRRLCYERCEAISTIPYNASKFHVAITASSHHTKETDVQ